jgi:hypothetical protein
MLVDLELYKPIDLLEDALGSRPLPQGREKHPTMEIVSRDWAHRLPIERIVGSLKRYSGPFLQRGLAFPR